MLVLTVSRIEPSKRPLDFVDVAAKVYAKMPKAEFAWVGDGTFRKVVEERVEKLGLSNVTFTGYLSDHEKARLLSSSNVYVSTSESEGFALTPGEALLRGVPVVVYDLPVYREVYRDYLVYAKPFDTSDFAQKVGLCLDPPEWVLKKVEEGGRYVKLNYSREVVGRRALSLFKEILN